MGLEARLQDLVSVQSFLPSIQIGGFDKPSWMPSKSGKFNTSETFEAIRFKSPVVARWKIVCFSCAITKNVFILWLTIKNRHAT
jgi:hypothetical protein